MNLAEIRIPLFIALTGILLAWELKRPVYKRSYSHRMWHNYVLLGLSAFLLKISFPAGLAIIVSKTPPLPWHLRQLPMWLELPLTIIAFDFAIYWQHRFAHQWNWLWQFHSVHHSDKSLDFSSAARFHPGEILISGFYKLLLISIIGPSAVGFLLYEILLSSFALFNHSNISIPKAIDQKLRLLFVTPEMHYPHHSPNKTFTNQNYGNILSIWDRLFKTYTTYENREFGLDDFSGDDFKQIFGHPFTYDYFKKEKD